MRVFKLGIWFIFALFCLVFFASLAGQNQEAMNVNLFRYTTGEYQKWIVLVASFTLGAFFATLFFVIQLVILETKFLRLRRAYRKLQRTLPATPGTIAAKDPIRGNEPAARLIDADDV